MNVAAGAVVGATAAASFAFPVAIGAGLGAAASVVKFELKPDATGAKMAYGASRFLYALNVKRELGQV